MPLTAGSHVVEVIPSFHDLPENWLDIFDTHGSALDLYNIPSPGDVIQVLLSQHVKTVAENVKRLPGRRVTGARAEACLVNPYPALGEAAIDGAQFVTARAGARLRFK
jgi:hypothetical protein